MKFNKSPGSVERQLKRIVVWLMCMMMPVIVLAQEDTAIHFNTSEQGQPGIYFEQGTFFSIGGLWANFEAVYPGESREQTIELSNTTDQVASFYLVMSETAQEGVLPEEQALVRDLLYKDLLHIQLIADNQVLYDDVFGGNLGKASDFQHQVGATTSQLIPIGSVMPNQKAALKVHLTVDSQMDNRYENLMAKVNWGLEVRWSDTTNPVDPTVPVTPTNPVVPDNPTDPTVPDVVTLPDEVVPAGPAQPEINVPDEQLPLGPIPGQEALPKTGDTFPVGIFVLGMVMCAGIMIVVVIERERKNRR